MVHRDISVFSYAERRQKKGKAFFEPSKFPKIEVFYLVIFLGLKDVSRDPLHAGHGQFFRKGNYLMTAVYHPAALLRDASKKEDMLRDMERIKQELDRLRKETLS